MTALAILWLIFHVVSSAGMLGWVMSENMSRPAVNRQERRERVLMVLLAPGVILVWAWQRLVRDP